MLHVDPDKQGLIRCKLQNQGVQSKAVCIQVESFALQIDVRLNNIAGNGWLSRQTNLSHVVTYKKR